MLASPLQVYVLWRSTKEEMNMLCTTRFVVDATENRDQIYSEENKEREKAPSKVSVKALVRWATGKRFTNRLPKVSLIALSPPSEQRGLWSSYGAVRAYSEVLDTLWGPRESVFIRFLT